MAKRDDKTEPALGFLTVVEYEQHGLFGGYLVLNLTGRPLEFHCTAPVKPNRAQQILYGPTLEPYLYGEQIGQALVAKGAQQVLVVCTDRPAVLAVRGFVPLPTVLVDTGDIDSSDESNALMRFLFGRNKLAVPVARLSDREAVCERLQKVGEAFDLGEPFGRIRAAIEEAQRGSSRAVIDEAQRAGVRAAA
jgi:hypothetical protein